MSVLQHDAPSGARRITPADSDFPAALCDLQTETPRELWVKGTLAIAAPPAVAIVGTRNATPYGLRTARVIAQACARAGVAVVSGLARGIDAAAHQAALDAGGRTVAVLGTGIDLYYPRNHRALQDRIAQDGLVMTEVAPGTTGHGGSFPLRNRMIAALSQVVVVVEAGLDSGALITSRRGVDLNRHVMVVPGPIDSPSHKGSNAKLNEPPYMALCEPADVLRLLNIDASPPLVPTLTDNAARCWDAMRQGATDITAVARASGLSHRTVASVVSSLEIDGLVTVDAGGRIVATMSMSP